MNDIVTWETLAPPDEVLTTGMPERLIRQQLVRLLGAPVKVFTVIETYQRVAVVDWEREPAPQTRSYDPVAPIPLVPYPSNFPKLFRRYGELQEQYVNRGRNPHPNWQQDINNIAEAMIDSLRDTLSSDELAYYEGVLWDITTNIRDWVTIPGSPVLLYAIIFLVTFLTTLLVGFWFSM